MWYLVNETQTGFSSVGFSWLFEGLVHLVLLILLQLLVLLIQLLIVWFDSWSVLLNDSLEGGLSFLHCLFNTLINCDDRLIHPGILMFK